MNRIIAPISSYYWDFGDVAPVLPSPAATFICRTRIIYAVKLAITGYDGCISIVGFYSYRDYPIAGFDVYDTQLKATPH
jgi:hypothetical protein